MQASFIPWCSKIRQGTQAFAVQISAPKSVKCLQNFGNISKRSEIKIKTSSYLEPYTNSSLSSFNLSSNFTASG